MMANLFSSFDPSSNMNLSLNWMSTFIGLIIMPSMFWMIPSRFNIMWMNILSLMQKEFKTLIKEKKSKGNTLMMVSIFMMILLNNMMGLMPYVFTSTSHMLMTLSLALPMWISFMVFGWINNTTHMLAHLVPQGTPTILMPFMVCIETVSNIIRPGTLAIRLSANMIAGHLLLTLLGNTGNSMSKYMLMILILVQIMLLLLEFAVSMIQAYVFSILTTLYSSEV